MPGKINLDALHEGDIIVDHDEDEWVKRDGQWWFLKPDGQLGSYGRSAEEMEGEQFGPFTRPSHASKPDLYQQARIALRDSTGTEPTDRMVRFAVREMEAGASGARAVELTQIEFRDPTPAAPNLSAGFGIAVSGGGFAASATVHTDDTVNGLARLRAHAALDQLLDQHGISR